MAKNRKKAKVVVKKKTWVKILSTDNKELGQCHIEEPKKIIGRRIKVNLMNFLNDPKKRKYNIAFVVTEYDGIAAKTKIFDYSTQPTSIKMAIRKGQTRVDGRYVLKTKDASVIIKPLMITRKNVTNSVKTALRKACQEEFKNVLAKIPTEELFKQLIIQKIQREVKKKLAKVYPLKAVEIKKATMILEKAKEEVKKAPLKVKEEVKEEKVEVKKEE